MHRQRGSASAPTTVPRQSLGTLRVAVVAIEHAVGKRGRQAVHGLESRCRQLGCTLSGAADTRWMVWVADQSCLVTAASPAVDVMDPRQVRPGLVLRDRELGVEAFEGKGVAKPCG